MADKVFDLSILIQIVDKVTTPIKKVTNSLNKLGNTANKVRTKFKRMTTAIKSIGPHLWGMGRKIEEIGRRLSIWLIIPLAMLGKSIMSATLDMNKGMAEISTLLDTGIERVHELEKAILDLSVFSGRNLKDMTSGTYDMISAFGDSVDMMKMMRVASKLAVAGVSTIAESVDLLTTVMRGYNMVSLEAAEKTANLAFLAVKIGKTKIPYLAQSIGAVASAAHAVGVPLEELFAGFATLAGTIGNTAEALTSYRSLFMGIMKPTKDLEMLTKAVGKAMGKEFGSAMEMVKHIGFAKFIRGLGKALEGKEHLIAKLFGNVRALKSALALTGPLADKFAESLQKMMEGGAVTNEAFEKMVKTVGKASFTWDVFLARTDAVKVRFGKDLLPMFNTFIIRLSKIIMWIDSWSASTKISVTKLALFAIALTATLIILGLFIQTIGAVVGLIGGPGILLLIGLGVLAALMLKNKDRIMGYLNEIKDNFKYNLNEIKNTWEKIKKFFIIPVIRKEALKKGLTMNVPFPMLDKMSQKIKELLQSSDIRQGIFKGMATNIPGSFLLAPRPEKILGSGTTKGEVIIRVKGPSEIEAVNSVGEGFELTVEKETDVYAGDTLSPMPVMAR